jgi:hypothetical protein
MPRLVVSPAAAGALARLIVTHSLPPDTNGRFRRSSEALAEFPLLDRSLGGSFEGLRFVLGRPVVERPHDVALVSAQATGFDRVREPSTWAASIPAAGQSERTTVPATSAAHHPSPVPFPHHPARRPRK